MYTPLYSALLELKEKNQLGFHMPGHLGKRGMEGFDFLVDIDTTELTESDNLFLASGPIAEAERAAASFFGAKKTRFLVGGSSGGVLSMVGAAVGPGDKIICDRFCHRSLVSALVFSGAEPVWVCPETVENGALWGGINPEDVEKAILENPGAKAVYITSPNYFGFCSDVRAIAAVAHWHSLPFLVDSAHGAHFGLSPLLPPPAWRLGADLTAASAHKTLPALTQAAYLHINKEFPRLESMLKMCQSSSPSYILMASLDFARAKMEDAGEELWSSLVKRVLAVFPEQTAIFGNHAKFKDPTRLILPAERPFQAAEELRARYNIAVECCYGGGVVCITNPAHTREELERLRAAADKLRGEPMPVQIVSQTGEYPLSPREAFYAECENVEPESAEGRICAREVVPYPPGVPLLVPGQRITKNDVSVLDGLFKAGAEIHGFARGKIAVVSLKSKNGSL